MVIRKRVKYLIVRNPNYLSRSNNLSGNLEELPQPKFTRSVMRKPC